MTIFSYKAYDEQGKLIKGYIVAQSVEEAFNFLTIRNLYVLSLREIPKILVPFFGFFVGKISNEDLIEFSKNLSSLLKAGIILTTALSDISENVQKERFKRVIEDVKDLVEKGVSFSEALEKRKDVFPEIFIHLIRIGEQTGRLDKSLEDVAAHFQRIEDLRTSIKRSLMYPVFATVSTLGAMLFWMVYVLPKIIEAMKGMGVEIPLITMILVKMGQWIKVLIYLLPLVVFLIFIFRPVIKRSKKYKELTSYLSFKIPIIKEIFFNRTLALFCEQMRILIGAGITIDTSLSLTRNVIENELVKTSIENARERIISGERISEALKKEGFFPSMIIRLVDVGEASGTLEDQFSYLSTVYTNKLLEYSNRLGKILEPVTISVVGAFFAIVLLSLLSPVYDLISKIGRG
ncbi:MAG: type II secretion system F family protein [Deltaproteobacteria bacterium]|nr:type II secretion system F family protein [Deltaproteobacteria bacterium]